MINNLPYQTEFLRSRPNRFRVLQYGTPDVMDILNEKYEDVVSKLKKYWYIELDNILSGYYIKEGGSLIRFDYEYFNNPKFYTEAENNPVLRNKIHKRGFEDLYNRLSNILDCNTVEWGSIFVKRELGVQYRVFSSILDIIRNVSIKKRKYFDLLFTSDFEYCNNIKDEIIRISCLKDKDFYKEDYYQSPQLRLPTLTRTLIEPCLIESLTELNNKIFNKRRY